MHIKDIWPFLLPAVLLQIFMQILSISETIKEKNQKSIERRIYILSIAIFGLSAIAFNLLRAEKTPPKDTTLVEVERSNHLTTKGIFYLLLIAYQVMGLHMLAENVDSPVYRSLLWLLAISFLIMLLYNLLPEKKQFVSSPILPIIQLIMCIPIQYMDISGDNLFLSIIAGFSAINHAPLSHSKVYGISALASYLIGSTARTISMSMITQMSDLVRYFFVNTLVVLLALIAFYTLKKQIITSIQLKSALNTVKEQSEQIKGLAVVEERNRIAAEMHDTVGHTLTAAVLSLEAGKNEQGIRQVRRGLSELRESVKVVRAGADTDFVVTFELLLHEIYMDTGLRVQSVIESKINLSPLHTGILLSVVKECATNAIKHGHATEADILIGEHQGQLRLSFTDNGIGTDDIKAGSGLSIMRERVESIGGRLETESAYGEGFTVSLLIPTQL